MKNVKRHPRVLIVGLLAALMTGCATRAPLVLTPQQQNLVGKRLHWAMFRNPPDAPASHHVHCAFCSEVIAENPQGAKAQRDGYTTDDESDWVCNACFDRLNPRFRWVVLQPGPANVRP